MADAKVALFFCHFKNSIEKNNQRDVRLSLAFSCSYRWKQHYILLSATMKSYTEIVTSPPTLIGIAVSFKVNQGTPGYV